MTPTFDLYVRPRRGLFRRWKFIDGYASIAEARAAAETHKSVEYEVRQSWAGGTTR